MAAMLEHRFTSKFVEDENGCWIWQAAKTKLGYGVYMRPRAEARALGISRRAAAHRYSYEAIVGPIPEGLVIDHLCRMPPCVNPDHLEAVTVGENLRRGAIVGGALWDGDHAPTRTFAARTQCKYGHEFTPENSYYDPAGSNHRRCRECSRIKMRRIGPPKPRTHCRNGHEFEVDGYYVGADGYRDCKPCMLSAQRRYRAKE